MFIFKVNYKKPMAEVERFLGAHREYLDKMFAAGKLVASGPQEPRTGGVILCNVATCEEAREIVAHDPFYIEQIADYDITQFHVTKHSTANFEASFE